MALREYEWIPDETATPAAAGATGDAGSISACVIVYNEAATIARCLDSLKHVVDEIVVVHDGPCTDATLDIARRAGCRVFEAPRYGHCEHHLPFACEQTRGEWLLIIDADEFLSPELAGAVRDLARNPDVDGYEFLWRLWDGTQYFSANGPFKLALSRKRCTRVLGLIHAAREIDGRVVPLPLALQHQPGYANFTMRTMFTKWRARARLHAREYLSDVNTIPRFNYPGTMRWSRRRQLATRLAPLAIVPAGLHTFWFVLRDLRNELTWPANLRFSFTQGVYRAMVTAYVAKLQWRPGGRHPVRSTN